MLVFVITSAFRSTDFFEKNKPNGQYFLRPDAETIRLFMKELSIRKLPGVGRVNERLLESIGIKARDYLSLLSCYLPTS